MSVDFARDGHLLDLALERFVLEDLPDAERRAAKAHLRDCALCRSRAAVVQAELAVPMPPLDLTRAGPPATPAGSSRAILLGAILGLFVLAIALVLRAC